MMNPVVHFEMPYRERTRAARFYAAAFGWQTQALGEEMGNYLLLTTAVADVKPGAPAGAINGGMFEFKPDWPDQTPSVTIAVEDMQAAMARVRAAGGEVLGEPMVIPGIGLYVSVRDTEGNRVSLLEPLPMSA